MVRSGGGQRGIKAPPDHESGRPRRPRPRLRPRRRTGCRRRPRCPARPGARTGRGLNRRRWRYRAASVARRCWPSAKPPRPIRPACAAGARRGPVEHLIGDLVAPMGWKAVHEDRVLGRVDHEVGVDPIGLEDGTAELLLVLLTHRVPGVGDHHRSPLHRLLRVVDRDDRRASERSEVIQFAGGRRVAVRTAEPDLHPREGAPDGQ